MKKIIISFIVLIGFTLPIKMHAVEMTNASITGTNYVKATNEYEINVHISFSGINDGTPEAEGVGMVLYNLDFDPAVLTVHSITSKGYESVIGIEKGIYVATSIYDEADGYNACSDGLISCDTEYNATIKFKVNDVYSTTTNIGIYAEVIVTDVIGSVTDDTVKMLTYDKAVFQTINIVNENKVKPVEPTQTQTPKPVDTPKPEKPKDANTFLKSIEIKNHEITFDKNTRDYILEIDENENSLEITALPESDKSTVKITGADDLKTNNYKVEIEVKAEDSSIKTYTIKAKTKEDIVQENTKEKENKTDYKITKKIVYILIGSISGFLLIGLSIILRTHIKNKKIDKMLNQIDK